MTVPTLETPRLVLRGPTVADFDAHFALWGDPRTVVHFGGVTYSEEETWLRFRANIGHWQLFGYGNWGVVEQESGRYIGALGFFQARRPFDPTWRDHPEAGWAIHPDFHGRGYAREALAAAIAWADTAIDAPQTWCMINPSNDISRKVAERAGYRLREEIDYKGKPVLILTRPHALHGDGA